MFRGIYRPSSQRKRLPRTVFEGRVKIFNSLDYRLSLNPKPYMDTYTEYGASLYFRSLNVVVDILIQPDYTWKCLTPIQAGSWVETSYNEAYKLWMSI